MISRLHSQALISLADQAMFSGAMLLVNILLARWTSPEEYGAFTVLFALFLIFAGFHNALLVEPMSVYGVRKKAAARHTYFRHVYLMHAAVAALLAFIAGIAILILDGDALQHAKWGLPLAIPLAMTFWLARRACYVKSRPEQALFMSTVYATGVTAGLAWLHHTEALSAFSGFVVFGVAGFLVSLPVIVKDLVFHRALAEPKFESSFRQHLAYGRWSLGESVAFALGTSILPLVIAYFMTVGDAGKFRAVQILFLPLTHLITGLGLLLLPLMSRLRIAADADRYNDRARTLLISFVVLALVYTLPILAFTSELLTLAYGNTAYLDLTPLVPYLAVAAVAGAISAALMIILRSSERPDLVFVASVAGSVTMLTVGIAAIAAFAMSGIAVALILGSGVTAVMLAWSAHSLLERPGTDVSRKVEEGANV